jgi:hypothetical protein
MYLAREIDGLVHEVEGLMFPIFIVDNCSITSHPLGTIQLISQLPGFKYGLGPAQ